MTYRQRLTLAAVCSVALHLAVLAPGGCRPKTQGLVLSRNEPIVLELQPEPAPPAPPIQQLVDVLMPADEPVNATELIAEKPSKAADEADDAPGAPDTGKPRVDNVTGFDRIARRAPAPEAVPAPRRVREPVQPPDLRREKVAAAEPEKTAAELLMQDGQGEKREPVAAQGLQPEPAPPLIAPQVSRGRVEGGVKRSGLLSFEAMESEIAPYLKVIRQRVERNWRTALHTRYSGTSRTRAVLDCAIAPDGHIIEVAIVEPGDSATFAPLCKQAVENAGPFDPFPFEVPEVYRSKNLEIRWTFSFLD
ncbi:MAG: TonB C-terminal domain-containing protein [Candidatus Hydrogenedentes bacterium]|nr:TonB C-terminal domain-containing protein [Candidatus Hydrogenedentota bacterium]